MSNKLNIGAVASLKIDVLTETGWFDDAKFKQNMAEYGGAEQTQYRVAWATVRLIVEQIQLVAESTGKRGKSRGSQAVAQRCLTIAGKYGTSGWFGTARREPR